MGVHWAWATVLGAFLIQFCGFGYTTSFGVYQDFYVRDYLSQSSPSANRRNADMTGHCQPVPAQ
ncbi:hypothetical protein C8F04DRAFT_1063903 [Mycena alexandri]|uniref:Uncharacterized protein n=1 Tax=Mycena alexandri TaxID=1745969 RepID=A0AAD6TGR5_9AGAR|nr:hypothetical protein C8F04DRAFT_1063903 [Mycena alexandri]